MLLPDIGTLKSVQQDSIRIMSATQGDVKAASVQVAHVDFPAVSYDGETVITPSLEEQTVSIAGKIALTDITINSIPSNYGLITWNGACLTVS